MREFDRRTVKDRRKQPTSGISRFTLWGQRKTFRRKEDQKRGGYVERYHSGLLILITLTLGLTVLDALFTIMILDDGGGRLTLLFAPLSNSVGIDSGSGNLELSLLF